MHYKITKNKKKINKINKTKRAMVLPFFYYKEVFMHKIFTLKNGLRVVTEKLDGVNSVSVGVMIQNGSRNESEELNGISHFIEHMFFKGTNKRTAKQIAEEIENVGGQINAFTSKETTCYYIKTLSTHLDLSLDVLSDMLLNSKFDEEEIEKEERY